jgi:hypothetical protein
MEKKEIKRCLGNKGSKWYWKKTKGPLDLYQYYIEKCKTSNKKPLSYNQFKTITNACNREVINQCLNGEIVKFPGRSGYLQLCKYKKSFNLDKARFHVDWGRSIAHNTILYYDDVYIHEWKWLKKTSLLKMKSYYKFKAARDTSRAAAKAIHEGKDFFSKPIKYT